MSAAAGFCLRNDILADYPGARQSPEGVWSVDNCLVNKLLRSMGLTWTLEPHPDGGWVRHAECSICGPLEELGDYIPFRCVAEKHRAFYDELEAANL